MERELELKEKQLEEEISRNRKNAESDKSSYDNTGSIDNSTLSKYGIITGNKVIIRKSYSTKSKFMGSFKQGERVHILDEYYPTNDREAISKSTIYLYNKYGTQTYTLVPGKALEVLSESYGEFKVRFLHPDYGYLTATVNASDLEFISGEKWYRVRRSNGQEGWVYSKFVSL